MVRSPRPAIWSTGALLTVLNACQGDPAPEKTSAAEPWRELCGVEWGDVSDPDVDLGGPPRPAVDALGLGKAIDADEDYADRTEVRLLSGVGTDDAVPWDFMVTGGRNPCVASKLPVPSHWEFHEFGTFHYGSERRSTEQGIYRRRFEVPLEWEDRQVYVVFEGSMTDTTVTVNGRSAGPTHQGGFYRFRYDLTRLLRYGASNELAVTVAKESSDASVNEAERQADYWTFGGIFRPVYLEASPRQSIDRLALDARADGTLNVDATLRGVSTDAELTVAIFDESMTPVGEPLAATVLAGASEARLSGSVAGVEPWSAERPRRYRVAVTLASEGGDRHEVRANFGFRSVEVRPGDGIYVNGTRVMLKGVNRHSFWPDSGRATSPSLSRADAELLKSMNMNAVRSSHYPSDRHFYEAADALGLYVLDELAGWQSPPYDTEIGRKLVEELVTFNVNHPSILFWDNGNEGGWNPQLDPEFARWDPQARTVLHPWANFGGINTDHYETYASTVAILGRDTLFMPTEFLHGLYDGGGGAGLEDHWNAMRASPLGAGGFLWALVDEGVRRTDGSIDVKGNAAPDGIVGPYREKEGSYYTVRELWSPVQIDLQALPTDFTGAIPLENHFDFEDISSLRFDWQLVHFDLTAGERVLDAGGSARTGSIGPGESGTLELALPADWRASHVLSLSVVDASDRVLGEWSWMTQSHAELRASVVVSAGPDVIRANDGDTTLSVEAAGTLFEFSKETGRLLRVMRGEREFPLANGPTLSTGSATLDSFSGAVDGDAFEITATYTGDLEEVRWRVQPSGWLSLYYRYSLSGTHEYMGINFDAPEAQVERVEWLGKGPSRVWRNRMKGARPDLFSREKNDAITGQLREYPEFKGYFADLHWARLHTAAGPIVIASGTPELFLRLYTPRNGTNPQNAAMSFPAGDLSFLHGIAAIGDKFLTAAQLGPQGEPYVLDGDTFEGDLDFYFGD